MKVWKVLIPTLVPVIWACDGSYRPSGEDVVAMAAGFELKAESAAEILAPQTQIPSQPEVVETVADLWIQYFLLARTASEDTTFSSIDLTPLVKRQVEGELVAQLRERVIQVDTVIPEEELRRRYEEALPGGQIRARHILLRFPDAATDAQVDSVRSLAEALRARLLEGESFEDLARQYSQDTGTAGIGGDLGSFGKNEMVPPFEAAAFALAVGEISEVVETTFGLHLIRVDERITPPFEERRDQFRAQLQSQMVIEAESTYVARVVDAAEIEVLSEGFETVRQLATDLNMELAPRALGRTLVRYKGGEFTVGEFREWIRTSPPNLPPQISAAADEQLGDLLTGLTRSELLVNEARAEGMDVPASRRDSLATGLLAGMKGVARQLGFFQLEAQEGETLAQASDRVVREILAEIVQGRREAYQLQTVAYALKDKYSARIYQAGVNRAVERVNELRSQAPPAVPVAPADTMAPDTAESRG
jgi:hypothetical protein